MSTNTQTVIVGPYDARQCPECEVWVLTSEPPFAEDDPTKTLADWFHWRDEHLDPATDLDEAVGFPYFDYNEVPVRAVRENRDPEGEA